MKAFGNKYTAMWEAGHTVPEIYTQALDDEIEGHELDEILDTLCLLEDKTEFDIDVVIVGKHYHA